MMPKATTDFSLTSKGIFLLINYIKELEEIMLKI
jgi:hypothetical protein